MAKNKTVAYFYDQEIGCVVSKDNSSFTRNGYTVTSLPPILRNILIMYNLNPSQQLATLHDAVSFIYILMEGLRSIDNIKRLFPQELQLRRWKPHATASCEAHTQPGGWLQFGGSNAPTRNAQALRISNLAISRRW